MDFLMEQSILYTSKKFENIYIMFKDKYKISYDELFILAVTIGFLDGKRSPLESKGREFRTNYLKRNSKATAYSIILNDPVLGKQIDKFEDKEFVKEAKNALEEYAERGMEVLVNNIFKKFWDGNKLDEEYKDYVVDLTYYVYERSATLPF